MTEIETDSYDADGNLIETDQYPGNSQPTRITRTMYNWQDRLLETESGLVTGDTTTPRSIVLHYDNQGEVAGQDTYNGTGIDIADLGYTGGVQTRRFIPAARQGRRGLGKIIRGRDPID